MKQNPQRDPNWDNRTWLQEAELFLLIEEGEFDEGAEEFLVGGSIGISEGRAIGRRAGESGRQHTTDGTSRLGRVVPAAGRSAATVHSEK